MTEQAGQGAITHRVLGSGAGESAGRYVALLAIGIGAVLLVGLTGFQSARLVRSSSTTLFAANQLLATQQSIDAALHELHEIIEAAAADPAGPSGYADEVAAHAAPARTAITANEALVRRAVLSQAELAAR